MDFSVSNILFSKPFRRLGDKTQMISYQNQVHFRNRMTHSLEVAEIADEIARLINNQRNSMFVDRDLLRKMCIVHDFGHTPFGHIGERTINKLLSEYGYSFKHNVFSYKILSDSDLFENVEWEVLDGVLKHSSLFYKNKDDKLEVDEKDIYLIKNNIVSLVIDNKICSILNISYDDKPDTIYKKYMECSNAVSIEGQILAISDDIAQKVSDLDDAFRYIRIQIAKKISNNQYLDSEDENINIDMKDEPFYNSFLKIFDVENKSIREFGMNLQKECQSSKKGINLSYEFSIMIRDFFIKQLISNLNIKRLQRYSSKNQIVFDEDTNKLNDDIHDLFYNDFHNIEEIKNSNDTGEKLIESLFEKYDDLSRCTYAMHKIKKVKSQSKADNKKKKLSTITDKKTRNKIALILLEEIAKMTNNYVINECNQIKDFSMYEFNGAVYNKRDLVLAVVKKYVRDNCIDDFNKLKSIFPNELRNASSTGKGVVSLESEVNDKDKGIGENSHKRFFVEDPIVLKNGDVVLVCTEWGRDNIDKFIKHVEEKLNYTIKKLLQSNNCKR